MRRLLRNTLLVFVLCVASISAAVLVARSQPLPERLAILHLDQCAPPCWIGITPGITTHAEAERILKEIFPSPPYTIRNLDSDHVMFAILRQSETLFTVTLWGNTGTIVEMSLNFEGYSDANYDIPTFADIDSMYGNPTSVYVEDTINSLILLKVSLIYESTTGFTHISGINQESPSRLYKRHISSISFMTPEYFSIASDNRIYGWRGFLPEIQYINEACKYILWCGREPLP